MVMGMNIGRSEDMMSGGMIQFLAEIIIFMIIFTGAAITPAQKKTSKQVKNPPTPIESPKYDIVDV